MCNFAPMVSNEISLTPKERYAQLCSSGADIPLFMQHWWLECVCAGKRWEVWLYLDASGSILAAMPYLYRRRMGNVRFVVQPTHSQLGGVWLSPEVRNDEALQYTIAESLVQHLKSLKLWYYYQQYNIGSPMVGILSSMGFTVKRRVTYRIDDVSDMAAVERACSKNKKRQLQHAIDLTVRHDMDPEEFYNYHRDTLHRRRREISYTREYFLVLYHHALRRGQGEIISLHDNHGTTLAAAFVVWDNTALYYLIPAFDISRKETGASARLPIEAMKLASEKGIAFDFEGSMIPGVAKHYQQYGTTAVEYFSVERVYTPLFRLMRWIYRIKNRKKI